MSRLVDSIRVVVEALIGRRVRLSGLFPCTVARQSGNLLDLIPDDEEIKGFGLQGVKIRHGLPGYTVEVPEGARVLLGFEAQDPARPYALLWDEGGVSSVSFDGGTDAVARVGDDAGEIRLQLAGGVVVGGFYRSPAGVAGGGIWIPMSSSVAPPAPTDTGTTITIGSGNTKLLA